MPIFKALIAIFVWKSRIHFPWPKNRISLSCYNFFAVPICDTLISIFVGIAQNTHLPTKNSSLLFPFTAFLVVPVCNALISIFVVWKVPAALKIAQTHCVWTHQNWNRAFYPRRITGRPLLLLLLSTTTTTTTTTTTPTTNPSSGIITPPGGIIITPKGGYYNPRPEGL